MADSPYEVTLTDQYEVSLTDRVRSEEKELDAELSELKLKIEENEMVYGIKRPRNVSSVPLPKDASYFRKEREQVIKRGMEVCEARPISIQADRMEQELEICVTSDYTAEGLPLLLHQFYTDRIQQLVQCKHMHMLRWSRFHEHTSTLEALYPHYQERLKQIMLEYNDCLARSQRLSVARESHVYRDSNAILSVKKEDLLIYLRWLVCHQHSTKHFNQYIRILQWLPKIHKDVIVPDSSKESQEAEGNAASSRISSRYQDKAFSARPGSNISHLDSGKTYEDTFRSPRPPKFNRNILSTNPLPAAQMSQVLSSAGGGLASDENCLCMPLHSTDINDFRPQLVHLAYIYGIEVNIENMSSIAEEMELYAAVNRKFREVFIRQEHMRTFKTYDRLEIGQENWGSDNSTHALRQDSNWLPFIKVKPLKDPELERKMVQLRSRRKMDQLLRIESHFLKVTETEKVQDALKDHAATVRDPPVLTSVPLSTGHDSLSGKLRTTPQIAAMWKKIYTNPELYSNDEDPLDVAIQEIEKKEAADRGQRASRPSISKKRKDSFDYMNSVQLLGLDEGEQDSNDPTSIQGAFISFLQLRHLRIRDLQRTCLSVLNYFRSVERTLTINSEGLSKESGQLSRISLQNHRKGVVDGSQGGGGGLGSHHYVHYTPSDFKMSQAEFMEFSDIQNHDDFYTHEEGRVHVQDQRGFYIMYDAAIKDLEALEQDLLMIASSYIEKDKERRNSNMSSARKRQQQQQAGDFDIGSYGHQDVDRFGVLLDLWTNEASYLECKRELLDCYLESYHHIYDPDEKYLLTQELVNIIYRRPRYDFTASYFIRCYRLECICLRLHTSLVKSILDQQIDKQREYLEKLANHNSAEFGLPHRLIAKQPISINMSRSSVKVGKKVTKWSHTMSALKNVYMLEFHPSLAVSSKLPEAIRHAYWELYHEHKPMNRTDMIVMEKKLLEMSVKEWENMESMGSSFSATVQKDIFDDAYIEDPVLVTKCAEELLSKVEEADKRKSQKERQTNMLNALGNVMHMCTLRHRLLDAAWESEVLSKVYRQQGREMNFDDFHLFIRFIQFEYATHKQHIQAPPVFITAVQEDDSMVDRITPKTLFLAIHELDESNVGRVSFAGHEQVMQALREGGVENLQVVLATQVVHKNALISAVQQAHVCHSVSEHLIKAATSPVDTKSEKSTATAMTNLSGSTGAGTFTIKLAVPKPKKSSEAFISLQLEKNPLRDKMLNEFVLKKAQMETVLRNPVEMARLKRKLLLSYCQDLQQRMGQYSLRSQIIAYYNSILGLLDDFPIIRDNYFMLGEAHEKKAEDDSVKGLESNTKSVRRRPRRVLTDDGKHLLNIWFIPHYTESLVMYKKLDVAACRQALTCHLKIVAALHDVLQYLCAHSRMGSSSARMGKQNSLLADWGGTEGIGTELFEIQRQINNLGDSSDPGEVSDFLVLRRDVMFLEFDAVVRHSMRDTFLATGNLQAYQTISDCMHHALHDLSNTDRPAFNSTYMNVPEPMTAHCADAVLMYPYRAFINRDGPYPVHFWEWRQIEYNMRMCLSGLKEVDSYTANGEILGLSLLMEDVLMSGEGEKALYAAPDDEGGIADTNSIVSIGKPEALSRPSSISQLSGGPVRKSLSKTQHPSESYKLLRYFLCLWKRLEMYKYHWGCQKLMVESISTPALYRAFCKEYRKEHLYPILQSVARRYGQGELYEGMVSEDEPLVMPRGASEIEIRTKQLLKLAESQECHMIREVRKKLNKELNLVLAERQREEEALPTDLWKKPVMKETVTINRPYIAEDFIQQLMSVISGDENAETITFTKDHFNNCLTKLSNDVMVRERHNYENYSMYYENVLRANHQLLYQREQEIKHLKYELRTAQSNNMVEVHCQLAETSHDLILEVIALRAKIEEMRESSMNQELIIRDRVREEYDELVQDMFATSFKTMHKFDKYKVDVISDIKKMIDNAKEQTITEMDARKDRTFTDDQNKSGSVALLQQVNKVRKVDQENHQLNILLSKTRAMNVWRQVNDRKKQTVQVTKYQQTAEKLKKECKRLQEYHQEELVLFEEQLNALQAALKVSEKECDRIRRELDKELKIKKDKQHTLQQQAQSQKQLMEARRANMDKLVDELEDKDTKLRQLTEDTTKSSKVQQITQDQTKKNMERIRKQLIHERSLKLDAFQRVDLLQTQVYDMEAGIVSRPQTAIGLSSRMTKSRSSSAATKRPSSRGTTPGANWPPAIIWPANRSLTPAGDLYASANKPQPEQKKIQRPKTANARSNNIGASHSFRPSSAQSTGQLRSRITQQLLYQLEPPDHYETLIQLKEMEQATAATY